MAYDLIKVSALPETTPSESQDIVIGEGDYAKRINYGDVKADMVGTTPTYTTDTEPYLMRRTAHTGVVGKCALNKLVGGSVAWNQLCNGSSVTVPNGHKYYMKKSGTASIGASTGSAITGLTSGTDMVIDLTLMCGSTIADYVYGLESATAGAGVAWLSKYIDLGTYHAYDAGSIQSVQATAHVTTGFNAWDEEWEVGSYDINTGAKTTASDRIRSKNYIPVIPSTVYGHNVGMYVYEYDGNKQYIGRTDWGLSSTFTTSAKTRYVTFISYSSYGTTYNNNICINISKTAGSPKNGDYVAYNGHTYPLDSSLTLRGIPQLVSNKLTYDGDIYEPDGKVTRKYGILDLGSIAYALQTVSGLSAWRAFAPSDSATGVSLGGLPLVCSQYTKADAYFSSDKSMWINNASYSNTKYIIIRDDSKASLTAAQFKEAMSGIYLVYPLETESTESSTAFQKVQTIDADGTESFTTSSPVPVGHETQTPDNILAALEWLGE